jgi:Acetyltransferases, including N-acetylases of ribosomal proteins
MLNHVGTRTLETERLILRRFDENDADDMYNNWVTDPEVSRFWSWTPHKNIEETKFYINKWIAEYSNPAVYHWVIVLKSIAQAVGYIYIEDNADDTVSVHYALSRKHWNHGIMSEACKCVIDFAFSAFGVNGISTRHHAENPASGRVMQKCGMRYVGADGDQLYYELTRSDWERVKLK